MLTFLGKSQRACDGISRRDVLHVGSLAAMGLTLPQLLGSTSSATAGRGRAHSCVLVYLFGGPSQLDTFDLKPEAPSHFRGEFNPIASNVPGIRVCEHLPRLAARADKYCLIRSMTHEHPRHGWGLYYMMTGQRHNRPDLDAPPTADDFPGIGALVNRLLPGRHGIPSAITLPRWNRFLDLPADYAGEKAGFMGSAFDPWLVKALADGESFQPEGLMLPIDVPVGRLGERRQLLSAVGNRIASWGEAGQAHDSMHAQAYQLVSSAAIRQAFDLAREPVPARIRYGRHPFGQGLLLARRLVEAGTRLVQVNWHNDGSDVKSPFWDTHMDNFATLRDRLLPVLDVSLSAFLDDMHCRGLLDTTLVLVMGEFGRTPRIGQVVMNAATNGSGRDHWPHAYTVLAAGAGIGGGTVHGASDEHAAFVRDHGVTPPDLHATILHLLGIDRGLTIHDRQGRPHAVSSGRPVPGLL